jgi:Protein of unknown function (DUF3306)
MTESESFIARWLRLKQEADASLQGTDSSAPPPVDPAHLPPIESITAQTDIRQFLQSGVPAELMRAALRTAWVADPVIRDFIGVSETQWDFNDPEAMPGFGPLQALDRAASLAARNVPRPESTDPTREAPAGVPATTALDRDAAKVAQPVPFPGTQERQVEAEQPPVRHGSALPKLG